MKSNHCRTDLPILLLYDLNPAWTQPDQEDRLYGIHKLASALGEVGHPVMERCVQTADLKQVLEQHRPDEYLVLNWCEELPGVVHSEYQVAEVLESMGFTFTGSSARTLALSQDKCLVKRKLGKRQIRVPVWQVYTSTCSVTWNLFPAIVKPAFEHCSNGISRDSVVQTPAELKRQVEYIFETFNQPAVVEEFIDGREFHVGVIGNGKLQMLPPGEIDYGAFPDIHDRLCTYESNVDKNSLAYQLTFPKLPVVLTNSQMSRLEEMVISAYRAIQCRDYARMDIRLQDDDFYVLDVNPNPDISWDTSVAMGAELAGLSYGELGSLMVNLAAQRHPIFGPVAQEKV